MTVEPQGVYLAGGVVRGKKGLACPEAGPFTCMPYHNYGKMIVQDSASCGVPPFARALGRLPLSRAEGSTLLLPCEGGNDAGNNLVQFVVARLVILQCSCGIPHQLIRRLQPQAIGL